MKAQIKLLLAAVGCFAFLIVNAHPAESPLPLHVLYIGHRASEFVPFLSPHFAKVESTPREGFQPQAAKGFDVVLLDWPQSEVARQEILGPGPLNRREEWSKPTVLLGSARLNLAVVWKVKAGAG